MRRSRLTDSSQVTSAPHRPTLPHGPSLPRTVPARHTGIRMAWKKPTAPSSSGAGGSSGVGGLTAAAVRSAREEVSTSATLSSDDGPCRCHRELRSHGALSVPQRAPVTWGPVGATGSSGHMGGGTAVADRWRPAQVSEADSLLEGEGDRQGPALQRGSRR